MERLYDSHGYPVNTVAVDAVLFAIVNSSLCVLVDQREQKDGEGLFSIPGRFLKIDFTPEESIDAELMDIGVKDRISYFEQLGVAGSPNRDPRKRIVSINYFGIVPFNKDRTSQPKTQTAKGVFTWVEVDSLTEAEMFADHFSIITNARERLANKMEYSLIGINFLDSDCFTANDIYQVYSVVWGEKLDLPNFRRKLLNNENVQTLEGRKSLSKIHKIARTSQAYSIKGDVSSLSVKPVLHPPILRKT